VIYKYTNVQGNIAERSFVISFQEFVVSEDFNSMTQARDYLGMYMYKCFSQFYTYCLVSFVLDILCSKERKINMWRMNAKWFYLILYSPPLWTVLLFTNLNLFVLIINGNLFKYHLFIKTTLVFSPFLFRFDLITLILI